MKLDEMKKDNYYLLPFQGKRISTILVDNQFRLSIYDTEDTIILAAFTLTDSSGSRDYDIEDRDNIGHALNLFYKEIKEAKAYEDGTLEINLEDNIKLKALPHPDFESWEIYFENGIKIISMPGGELALWDEKIHK